MSPRQEAELMDACRILFPSAEINRQFLAYMQLDGLKNAYRARVWKCHPDACDGDAGQSSRTELFRRSVEAYHLLDAFLKKRKPGTPLRRAAPRRKPASSTPRPAPSPGEQYYRGPFPTIELKLGLYLYYSGAVSYEAVVRALIWQRDQRPRLGDFARRWGFLNDADIAVILAATEIVGSFGERAVALGLLTQAQLNLLLLHQRSQQRQVGRYFVEQGLLSELKLRELIRAMTSHNAGVRETRQ